MQWQTAVRQPQMRVFAGLRCESCEGNGDVRRVEFDDQVTGVGLIIGGRRYGRNRCEVGQDGGRQLLHGAAPSSGGS
jgi:hypothetical protein